MFTVKIEPDQSTRDALDRLRTIDIDKEIRADLVAAVRPIVAEIKQEILTMPSDTDHETRGKYREGLRQAIARNVKSHVNLTARKTAVTISVDKHGGLENLAVVADGDKPWNHPVFGHGRVRQRPMPFFTSVIARRTAEVEAQIRAAVDRALARAGVR